MLALTLHTLGQQNAMKEKHAKTRNRNQVALFLPYFECDW